MKIHEGQPEAKQFKINITEEEKALANEQLTPPKPTVLKKYSINKSAIKTPRVGRETYDQVIFKP